ncbi:MAG: lipocalin family protein [Chitinophagaceae bacterium]
MKKHLILPAVLALFISCKKSNDDSCPTTMAGIAGSYKLVSFTVNGFDATDTYFEACEKDNIIELNANGTYNFIDAGVACDPPGGSTGSWSLAGNQFTIDLIPLELTLEDFDCTNIRGSADFMGAEVKATFRKQ